jgi:hypothetical protein
LRKNCIINNRIINSNKKKICKVSKGGTGHCSTKSHVKKTALVSSDVSLHGLVCIQQTIKMKNSQF